MYQLPCTYHIQQTVSRVTCGDKTLLYFFVVLGQLLIELLIDRSIGRLSLLRPPPALICLLSLVRYQFAPQQVHSTDPAATYFRSHKESKDLPR